MISLDTDRTISGLQVLELFACPIGKDENGNYVEHEDLSGTVQHKDGECWGACWNRETGRTTWDARTGTPLEWPHYLDLPK
jgi:hypothetical protein